MVAITSTGARRLERAADAGTSRVLGVTRADAPPARLAKDFIYDQPVLANTLPPRDRATEAGAA